MKKTISYTSVGGFLVVVLGTKPASPQDWHKYLEFIGLEAKQGGRQRVLLVSNGAALEAGQRRELEQTLRAYPNPGRRVALITGSTFVRGIIRALSIVDPSNRGFAPSEMEAALRYLEAPERLWAEMRQIATVFSADMD